MASFLLPARIREQQVESGAKGKNKSNYGQKEREWGRQRPDMKIMLTKGSKSWTWYNPE